MRNPRRLDRRLFVAAGSAALLAPAIPAPAAMLRRMDGGLPETFPTQDPVLARTIVGKSHVDLDTVTELVTKRPELAKAAWDWGFGDWESALGAASHMGRRDIAQVLIAHGARPDIYTYAMLDQVDVVRAICVANPGIQRVTGPHGITLLTHAKHGKAESVVAYLEELGDADIGQTNLPLDENAATAYLGTYIPQGEAETVFIIKYHDRRGTLTFQRDEGLSRALFRVADHAFAPGGAAAVRVTFDMNGDVARTLTVRDGDLSIIANRVSDA